MPKKQKNPLIVVIDTNILISYLFGGVTITSLIDAVEKDAYLPALSPYMENEFINTLQKPKIVKRVDISEGAAFMREWKNFAIYVTPRRTVTVCRDPYDNEILACGIEAQADFVITGDKDLLVLNVFHGIRIISPTDFVKKILRK